MTGQALLKGILCFGSYLPAGAKRRSLLPGLHVLAEATIPAAARDSDR